MHDILKSLIKQFMPFAQDQIGFENPPRLFLRQDSKNATNPLGKTAFYDPEQRSVTLYISNRHPKDILRSLGHELVHHKQNCDGQFDDVGEMGEGYAQTNPHLRKMEQEANMKGSMCLRDFEDTLKRENTIYFEHLQKGDIIMSTKDWKNGEIKSLLSEAWRFKMDLNKLSESAEDAIEEEEEIEEQTKTDRPDRVAGRNTAGRRLDEEGDDCTDEEGDGEELMEDDEVVEEDFPGKRDMDQHKSDLSEARLKEIIAYALKIKG